MTFTAPSCNGQCDGMVNASVISNPHPPFTYTWSPANTNSSSFLNACAGNYTIDIKDSQGCITTTSGILLQPSNPCVGIKEYQISDINLKVYPNPVQDILNIELSNDNYELNLVEIYNTIGNSVFKGSF